MSVGISLGVGRDGKNVGGGASVPDVLDQSNYYNAIFTDVNNWKVDVHGTNYIQPNKGIVRPTNVKSTGKFYFERTLTLAQRSLGVILWFLNPTQYTLEEFNADPNNTHVNAPNNNGAGGAGFNVFGAAIDIGAGKVWIRDSSGNWSGGGDPALGTTPSYEYPNPGNPVVPVFYVYASTDSYGIAEDRGKVIFDSADWVWPVPEGFGVWTAN